MCNIDEYFVVSKFTKGKIEYLKLHASSTF